MPLILVTAPAVEPVTLAEIKTHCRVDGNTDDAILGSHALAARQQAEFLTGGCMVSTVYDAVLSAFPKGNKPLEIPKPPLRSVTSVKYYDENNAMQTLSAALYSVDTSSDVGSVYPVYDEDWPDTYDRHDAVTIRFACGYPVSGGIATTPEPIRRWILIYAGTLYAHREGAMATGGMVTLPKDYVDGLLDNYTVRKRFG